MTTLAYAIFDNEKQAAGAVDALVERDFTMDDICILLREGPVGSKVKEMPLEVKTEVGPGMALGAAVGAIGGALVAVGSGGLFAAGPLFGALQGAVGGGAAGLLAGFVGGLGYWHDAADFPHHELSEGAVLVGVTTQDPGRVEAARAALQSVGASELRVRTRREAVEEVSSAGGARSAPLASRKELEP